MDRPELLAALDRLAAEIFESDLPDRLVKPLNDALAKSIRLAKVTPAEIEASDYLNLFAG